MPVCTTPITASSVGPAGWLSWKMTRMIGRESTASPTPMGMATSEVMRMADSAILLASRRSLFAMHVAMAGTMLSVSGVMK